MGARHTGCAIRPKKRRISPGCSGNSGGPSAASTRLKK